MNRYQKLRKSAEAAVVWLSDDELSSTYRRAKLMHKVLLQNLMASKKPTNRAKENVIWWQYYEEEIIKRMRG